MYLKHKNNVRELRFLHVAPRMKLLTHADQEKETAGKRVPPDGRKG